MSNAPNLQKIILRTQNDPSVDHRALFSHLRWALFQNGIRLEIQRSETIHDREIRFVCLVRLLIYKRCLAAKRKSIRL